MQQESVKSPPIADRSAQQPITSLRGWLDHLAARDRLAVIRRAPRCNSSLLPSPNASTASRRHCFRVRAGISMPVISGLVSRRNWIAEAMGVEPADVLTRFQDAALNPLPWKEVKNAPVQEVGASRSRS